MNKESISGLKRIVGMGRWINVLMGGKSSRFRPLFDATRLSALEGRLEVVRDRNGVAHLYADHEADLYVALGYLQASERGLHLDVLRHAAAGRLSEWIGGVRFPESLGFLAGLSLVEVDQFIRPLGFADEARRDMQTLSTRACRCLDAYAQGVNDAWKAGLHSPEQLLLGNARAWTPEDSLLAARCCALVMSLPALENELVFEQVRTEAGDDLARMLYPDAPWQCRPELAPGVVPDIAVPLSMPPVGSNNWAVAGTRTLSGKPLLANDPHVPLLPAPTFWSHVHLVCPHYNVQGGMYPGFPGFGFGHNAHVAWGITPALRDAWDLYRIERLPGAPSFYRTAEGVSDITRYSEPLRARFARAGVVEWERCAHGVIYPGWKHADGADLALRYVDCDHAAHLEGHLHLMAAQTPDDFAGALARINAGPFDFNIVHAHREGLIGWQVVGQLPRRGAEGLFVRNAHDAASAWQGYLPFADNPACLAPACGYVASAGSVADANLPTVLATPVHVGVDYRQRRIESLLAASDQHTLASMQAMQTDVDSDFSRPLRDALCGMLAPYQLGTPLMQAAWQALEHWNGVFDVDSVGATLFSLIRRRLPAMAFGLLLQDKGLQEAISLQRFIAGPRAVARLDRWLLDRQDPLHALLEARSGFPLGHWVGVAFERTLATLSGHLGDSVQRWRWGRVQQVKIATLMADLVPGAAPFVVLEAPFPGEPDTLSPAVASDKTTFGLRVIQGASSRFICDLAYPTEAWFAHSSGPSGDPETPYFHSVSREWLQGRWFKSALWLADEVPDVYERVIIRAKDLPEFAQPQTKAKH